MQRDVISAVERTTLAQNICMSRKNRGSQSESWHKLWSDPVDRLKKRKRERERESWKSRSDITAVCGGCVFRSKCSSPVAKAQHLILMLAWMCLSWNALTWLQRNFSWNGWRRQFQMWKNRCNPSVSPTILSPTLFPIARWCGCASSNVDVIYLAKQCSKLFYSPFSYIIYISEILTNKSGCAATPIFLFCDAVMPI